jgi:hypothetical protein
LCFYWSLYLKSSGFIFFTNYTLEDIQWFPISALNIVGYKVRTLVDLSFSSTNVFELAYWLILAYFIGKITETNMDRGLKLWHLVMVVLYYCG